MPDGSRPLRFRLFARQESNTSQQSIQFIQGWLRDIGIATDVKVLEENRLTEIIGQGEFDMFEWGWVVEPDPDYQLDLHLRLAELQVGRRRPGQPLRQLLLQPEYDKLYEQQKVTIDPAKRADIVKQMQRMLYDDAPYVVTFYYDELQAYRSDRFAGFCPSPTRRGGAVPVRHLQLPQHHHAAGGRRQQ